MYKKKSGVKKEVNFRSSTLQQIKYIILIIQYCELCGLSACLQPTLPNNTEVLASPKRILTVVVLNKTYTNSITR